MDANPQDCAGALAADVAASTPRHQQQPASDGGLAGLPGRTDEVARSQQPSISLRETTLPVMKGSIPCDGSDVEMLSDEVVVMLRQWAADARRSVRNRTSSPELQPITINAVNALLSVSPKTEPAPSPMNGLGALASLASLEDLTPKSRREAIQRLQEKRDANPMGRVTRRSRRSASGVTSSRRERARERERARAGHGIVGDHGYDDELADAVELLPQNACPEYNKHGRIGMYSPRERKVMLERWHRKRRNRVWRKVVRYGCRKNLANGRVRIKGRFVKSLPENEAVATSS